MSGAIDQSMRLGVTMSALTLVVTFVGMGACGGQAVSLLPDLGPPDRGQDTRFPIDLVAEAPIVSDSLGDRAGEARVDLSADALVDTNVEGARYELGGDTQDTRFEGISDRSGEADDAQADTADVEDLSLDVVPSDILGDGLSEAIGDNASNEASSSDLLKEDLAADTAADVATDGGVDVAADVVADTAADTVADVAADVAMDEGVGDGGVGDEGVGDGMNSTQ